MPSAMLLLVRLRALLFELCPDHEVAFCSTCNQGYKPEQLGTDLGAAFSRCQQCGADLRESLKSHARTCSRFLGPKPLARIDPSPPRRPFPHSRHYEVRY